jgi:hypothetical protein
MFEITALGDFQGLWEGFYKRGCQDKNTFYLQGGFGFLTSSPRLQR